MSSREAFRLIVNADAMREDIRAESHEPRDEGVESGVPHSRRLYFREKGRQPSFQRGEARAFFRCLQAATGREHDRLLSEFVQRNQGFVITVARLFRSQAEHLGVEFMDLVQYGNIGLMCSLEHYDPDRNEFTTYARWWVHQIIRYALLTSESASGLHLAFQFAMDAPTIGYIRREYMTKHRREATPEEVHKTMERRTTEKQLKRKPPTLEAVRTIMGHMTASTYSLDAPRSEESDAQLFGETVPDSVTVSSNVAAEARQELTLVVEKLDCVSRVIQRREGHRGMVIMHDRFGFQGEPKTLREAGAPWKIGPERARQIEARALQYVWKALQISKAELHEMIARRNALRELLRIE